MKPCSNELYSRIRLYIKNGNDISDLIKDVDIKGRDLSGAVIKYFNRVDCDISGTNFSYCQIGSDDKIVSIIKCDISNCNFSYTKFVGRTFLRSCKAHNDNFKEANVSLVEYQYTDFGETSNFCGAIIKIGTRQGLGAKFPKSMFKDLLGGWATKFKIIEESGGKNI